MIGNFVKKTVRSRTETRSEMYRMCAKPDRQIQDEAVSITAKSSRQG